MREGDWLKTARDKGDEDGDGVEGEPTVNVALRRDPVVSGDGVRFALADLGDELKTGNSGSEALDGTRASLWSVDA